MHYIRNAAFYGKGRVIRVSYKLAVRMTQAGSGKRSAGDQHATLSLSLPSFSSPYSLLRVLSFPLPCLFFHTSLCNPTQALWFPPQIQLRRLEERELPQRVVAF